MPISTTAAEERSLQPGNRRRRFLPGRHYGDGVETIEGMLADLTEVVIRSCC